LAATDLVRGEAERNRPFAQQIWRQTETIPAGLPFDYLTIARSISHWDRDTVRWHPACSWGRERVGCIICPVTCHLTGCTVAIWRIRPVMAGKVERMGLGPVKGNCAQLDWPEGNELAIAEGVEDGLAFRHLTDLPTWSALSAGNMRDIVLPTRFRRITIAADRDPNGQGLAAASRLAHRLRAEGRIVEVVQARAAKDANDVLAAKRKAANG
jgi:hypothetical protein